ncbi:GTP cyclohydrolase 1 type 2/Nif3 [Coprinopsis sp. MPI-PUGE-AT-0042]|nr:GTP cyclohydrolase 1 type 2/Nif3 [Coprinopsis sp. MPI-PUGE-AT-0042]KAH6911665.1 GTP cyclohydrolase 1 type 2/Nif3 [Coprinopsis sp. MPI-PUGE-AT-0042]
MASTSESTRYKLVFFTPPKALPAIKEAIFATGAGRYPGAGDYTKVCFTTPGVGQFLPGESAKPAIGEPGKLEEVDELRCEILCVGQDVAKEAVAALKRTHPYETVAYEVYKVEPF